MLKTFNSRRFDVLRLLYPFWVSGRDWLAWGLVSFIVAYAFGGVYLAVRGNTLAGALVDALLKRQWPIVWPVLLDTLAVGMAGVIGTILSYAATQLLNLRWRAWLTKKYVEAWTERGAYYALERDGLLSNADERIAQDIQLFLQTTLTLTTDLIRVPLTVVSFSIILWRLSGTIGFTAFGYRLSIGGYLVYIVFLYQILALLITHLSGRALIRLLADRQTVEANFRYRGMLLRENAEQIAFYRGGRREEQHLKDRFADIVGNWKRIIFVTSRMTLLQNVYFQSGSVVPTLAALPRYLAGRITLGAVTQITGAFNQVSGALSFFSQAYADFSQWVAIGHRLCDLSAALSRAKSEPAAIQVNRSSESGMTISGLTLMRPSGEVMATVPPVRIRQGERWLIRGRSGAGKSTYLRAIAGIWPYGAGTVTLSEGESLMFLPQRSYIPSGTLKAALCYPSDPGAFPDERCRAVLASCLLGAYTSALATEDRWQQTLSGGEQQRLAIARALLHRPAFVFLDEATSAQDGDAEQCLYRTLLGELPDSAVISVAHRETLEEFHEHVIVLNSAGASSDESSSGHPGGHGAIGSTVPLSPTK